MKIRDITWSNYRRLPDGHLQVRDHLVLVGPNDTGKSSIVRALNICLGMAHGQAAAAVSSRDFTDQALPLTFTLTLDGIEEDDRAAFPDEITVGPPEILVLAVEAAWMAWILPTRTRRRSAATSRTAGTGAGRPRTS